MPQRNRGKLLSRNLCRNPWQNQIDVSVGQSLQAFGRQNLQLRLDVLNFANLLNKKWGAQNFSDQGNTCGTICSATILLTHTGNVGSTGAALATGTTNPLARGVYSFDTNFKRWNATTLRPTTRCSCRCGTASRTSIAESYGKAGGRNPAGFFLVQFDRLAELEDPHVYVTLRILS